ncbi:hypothetical protein L6164_028465 [Bauhinia variegata]|uniref:Uncharacterized protein n=1 Tax=Bauhinia variegata TaxID=167791 RepID=A0ACB9L6Y1_BAUVA|nr:hypothetical protein L6164_028465 [Bauhinia variegata]
MPLCGKCTFLGHLGFYRRFVKDFNKITLSLSNLLQKDVDFVFGKGKIAIKTKDGYQKLIHDILYMPSLAQNLPSVGQ